MQLHTVLGNESTAQQRCHQGVLRSPCLTLSDHFIGLRDNFAYSWPWHARTLKLLVILISIICMAGAPDEGAVQVDRDGGADSLALPDRILPKTESADVEVHRAVLLRPPLEQRLARRRRYLRTAMRETRTLKKIQKRGTPEGHAC